MKLSILAILLGFFFNISAFAVDTPTSLVGIGIPSVEEVMAIKAAGGVIIDARPKLEYFEGHIPGAIHIAYKDRGAKKPDFSDAKDRFSMKKLDKATGGNKSTKVVFYCNGVHCWQSYKASIWAKKKGGYKNLYWFRGGLPAWKTAGKEVVKGQ